MAPRVHKESASESESKTPLGSRASQKARNAAAQAAQQEFLLRYINSNGPQDKARTDPLDFNTLSDDALEKYRKHYGLNCPPAMSLNAYILGSEIGKKTYSYKVNEDKITKSDMANQVKKSFLALPCRENEIIACFLYKVKNQDREFKLTFD